MYKSIPYSKSIIVLLQVRMALYLLLLLTATNSTGAQEPGCEVHNKKAERLFNSAGDMLKSGKPKEAYEYLIEAVREDPEYAAANYELAYINYNKAKSGDVDINNLKKRDQFFNLAVDYFTASIGLCPSIDDYKAHLYLGEMLYSKNDYVNAKHHLEAYVSKSKYYAEGKRQARSMLDKINAFAGLLNNPVPFNPKVVKGVSTSRDEFLPLVSPDGQYMFYTQRFMEKQKFSEVEKYQENFTISERISDYESEQDVFTKGKPMPLPFNDGRNQGGTAITIDNNHIYITICEQVKLPVNMRTATNNVYENCDICRSDLIDGKWTIPENLGTNINGTYTWESQPSISSDGKTIYFSTIRRSNIDFDENFPSCDIYYSELQEDGSWGPAKNLGSAINTQGNEKAPFMHSDSRTLYFASDGWPGIGGYDIFFSKHNPDGTWSEPKNIGYPINNELDNLGLIVSTYGKKAYFTSAQFKGEGGLDIFSFTLPVEARPDKVLLVKGNLIDEKGAPLTDAKVEMKSSMTQKVTEGMVDQKTGKYAVAVTVEDDEEFLMTVKKDNYAFSSSYIKPEMTLIEKPVQIELEVKSIEVGQTIEIKDIHFETGSWIFDNASIMILDNFAAFLEENPNLKFEIHGHTDNIGDDDENLILSERRARSVKNYLLLTGISSERITNCVGFGETKPVASNKNEQGRAKNRRTEFVIVSK